VKAIIKVSILPALLLALAVPQMSFADSTSGCVNGPNNNVQGTLYTNFVCSLYPSASSYTIDLTPNLTYDGADLYTNLLGPGYEVDINGDPFSLSDDSSGLWNQSLWTAVLYWPGDQDEGTASDSLTVYFAGVAGFPSVSDVQTLDGSLYGSGPEVDPYFFVQSGDPAVYAPESNEYDIYPTPEPSPFLLLGTGLLALAVVAFRKVNPFGLISKS
jgi:hypothetical protein